MCKNIKKGCGLDNLLKIVFTDEDCNWIIVSKLPQDEHWLLCSTKSQYSRLCDIATIVLHLLWSWISDAAITWCNHIARGVWPIFLTIVKSEHFWNPLLVVWSGTINISTHVREEEHPMRLILYLAYSLRWLLYWCKFLPPIVLNFFVCTTENVGTYYRKMHYLVII